MLEERAVIDQITVLEDGQIQVRRADKVFCDSRHVVVPGQNLTNEDPRVQKIAKAVHTAKVITDYHKAQAK